MRKARSRNFILLICAIFIVLILGSSVVRTVIEMAIEFKQINREKEVLANVLSSSSEIVLNGNANFIGSTPNVLGTSISNFNIKLSGNGDKAFYSIKFCNKNEREILYSNLVEGNVECRDSSGIKTDCSNVIINKSVYSENQEMVKNEVVKANGCVKFVVDFQYVGDEHEVTSVFIDKYALEFKVN